MAIKLYMDVHIPKAITIGLRLRNVDVITAQEDSANTLSDSELLDHATCGKCVWYVVNVSGLDGLLPK